MFRTSVNGNLADAFATMQNRITGPHVVGIMGFEIDVSRAKEVAPPTAYELQILREKCDPQRLILR